MNSSKWVHLTDEVIIRSLDDELSTAERLQAQSHLDLCGECRSRLIDLRSFSSEVEYAVDSLPLIPLEGVRGNIEAAIEGRRPPAPSLRDPVKVFRRFGVGVGLAAALACGLIIGSRHNVTPGIDRDRNSEKSAPVEQASVIEVDGEAFQPVPYSNPDLPINAPHIVQMEVPVSSLADAGIVVEPVLNRAANDSQTSVLADVLVGQDGQPRGVHVLE